MADAASTIATLSTFHGMSIGSIVTGAGVWTAAATLIGIVLRGRVPMRKMKIEAEEQLRSDLMEQLATDRKESGERIGKLEAELKEERLRHEAEASLLRHRANNSDNCLDALLMLLEDIEDLPDRVRRAVKKVKEMRAQQRREEALEKGAMHGVRLAASGSTAPVT